MVGLVVALYVLLQICVLFPCEVISEKVVVSIV
jgi:hypothetical protein